MQYELIADDIKITARSKVLNADNPDSIYECPTTLIVEFVDTGYEHVCRLDACEKATVEMDSEDFSYIAAALISGADSGIIHAAACAAWEKLPCANMVNLRPIP